MRTTEGYQDDYTLGNILDNFKNNDDNSICVRKHFEGAYEIAPEMFIQTVLDLGNDLKEYIDYEFSAVMCFGSDQEKIAVRIGYTKKKVETRHFMVDIFGDFSPAEKFQNQLKEKLKQYHRVDEKYVHWSFSAKGMVQTVQLPLKSARRPIHQEFYPFIPNLDNFFKNFFDSTSSVLIMDPMGTGKTSLITYLVRKYDREAITTYDQEVMKTDAFYANFITDDRDLLILEDADLILRSRLSDNKTMSKLLNVSDGIVDSSEKKMLFTANLENLEKINSAIMRPGRCFDVIEFRDLTLEEAKIAMMKIDETRVDSLKKKTYSLAELFNGSKKENGQNMGFIPKEK